MDTYNIQRTDLVQDLINTYDLYLEEPEHLREPHDLQRFLVERGLRITAPVTQVDLEDSRTLRYQLRLAWNAETPTDTIQVLNPLMTTTLVRIQFEEGEDQTAHLHLEAQSGTPLVQRVALECVLGIMDVLQKHGLERMRACASDPCQDVFIDTSRNNSRRFCSDRCANRYNINAFRERQKETKRGKA